MNNFYLKDFHTGVIGASLPTSTIKSNLQSEKTTQTQLDSLLLEALDWQENSLECASLSMLNLRLEITGETATKRCTVCDQHKPLEAFSKDKQKADGLYPHCKVCSSLNTRRRKEIRRAIPEPPDGCCQCCRLKKTLVVDHCHKSQEFRGWLCSDCNGAIGKLGDNLMGVLQAADYLYKSFSVSTHQTQEASE